MMTNERKGKIIACEEGSGMGREARQASTANDHMTYMWLFLLGRRATALIRRKRRPFF
jgi:hypothetical protein